MKISEKDIDNKMKLKSIIDFINSPEGEKYLEEVNKKSEEFKEWLDKAIVVPPDVLRERFNI